MIFFNKTRLVLLVAILSAAAGAVVFKTASVLFLLATLLAAPVLASAMSKWMSRGLRVSRQMPLVATVGDELHARLTVRNGGWIPALLVHAQGRGAIEKTARAPWRREKARVPATNAPEVAFFETVGEAELVVPILMPGASFTGEVVWKLLRRGLVAWPGARAGTFDPVALSDPLTARHAPAELLILPRPLPLRRLQLGGSSSGARPLRHAPADAAAEVHGVRPYQPGEGGRRIHWRATARTGQLHVIEWEDETASDLTILLDVHAANIAGTAGDDSLEMAITAAASVAAFLLGSGHRVRIFWWADEATTAGAARLMRVEARHQSGLAQVLAALAKILPCHNQSATLGALSARVARENRDESALLLGSDVADWSAALTPWPTARAQSGARGLAFDSASFAPDPNARFTLRAGAAMFAKRQRAETSDSQKKPQLPASVRRIQRNDSLIEALERNF